MRGSRRRSARGAGHLPRRPAAGRPLRARLLQTGVQGRRQAHVRRAAAALLVRRARGRGHQRARPRDPADVPHQLGHDRLHRHRVVGLLRARCRSDGVARRPGEAGTDRRVGQPRLRRSSCSSPVSRSSAFMLFWTRFATGIAKANSIPVHQSLIADNYPIGIRARMSAAINMGAPRHRPGQPGAVRCHRHVGGWGRGLAVGVVPAGHPGGVRRRPRVLHEGTAPRAVREAGRAR